jgi:hypothetical protein
LAQGWQSEVQSAVILCHQQLQQMKKTVFLFGLLWQLFNKRNVWPEEILKTKLELLWKLLCFCIL